MTVSAPLAASDARDAFVAAERALRAGDQAAYEKWSSGLQAYPLYPYLRFTQLTLDLNATSDAAIEAFLGEYPGTQLAARLRLAYLARLANAQRWDDYARVYRPDATAERQCLFLHALIATGRQDEAFSLVEPLWLSARSQPRACDPVFVAWRESGALNDALILKRLRLAMEAGETGLAAYLGSLLSDQAKPWHARWMRADGEPQSLLAELAREMPGAWDAGREGDHPAEREPGMIAPIVAHALVALGKRSPTLAAAALDGVEAFLQADGDAANRAYAAVGERLNLEHDPRAMEIWDRLEETSQTLEAQERRLRAAVARGDWAHVARWVERMPDGETKAHRWLYWLGRAQEALGLNEAAQATWTKAAAGRSLWAFLAADRVGLPYRFEHLDTAAEPERIRILVGGPTFARMRELARLDRETDMRREWRELLRALEGPDLLAAAYAADIMGWHDQAIQALTAAGIWDDLKVRFPLAHRDSVSEQSWQSGVGEDWIFAIIRQESVFARTLASHAGAIGLMQLMPATADEVAATLAMEAPTRWALLEPALNIRLGSAYLGGLRDRFGHVALATAAYNAGPSRVVRWLPEECLDADRWILSIPFSETRRYVERVLAYRVIYAERLGLAPTRLSDWLIPVPGAGFFRS